MYTVYTQSAFYIQLQQYRSLPIPVVSLQFLKRGAFATDRQPVPTSCAFPPCSVVSPLRRERAESREDRHAAPTGKLFLANFSSLRSAPVVVPTTERSERESTRARARREGTSVDVRSGRRRRDHVRSFPCAACPRVAYSPGAPGTIATGNTPQAATIDNNLSLCPSRARRDTIAVHPCLTSTAKSTISRYTSHINPIAVDRSIAKRRCREEQCEK